MPVDRYVFEHYIESKYRKAYACSHEEYLNEPDDTVQWLYQMLLVEEENEHERQRRANEPAGRATGNWGPR